MNARGLFWGLFWKRNLSQSLNTQMWEMCPAAAMKAQTAALSFSCFATYSYWIFSFSFNLGVKEYRSALFKQAAEQLESYYEFISSHGRALLSGCADSHPPAVKVLNVELLEALACFQHKQEVSRVGSNLLTRLLCQRHPRFTWRLRWIAFLIWHRIPPNTAQRAAGCTHRRSTLCLQRYLIKMYPMLAPFINLTL